MACLWRKRRPIVRNHAHAAQVQRLAKSLVVAKKKKTISFEWAAGSRSELISSKGRNGSVVERAGGIEGAVSHKFKNRAMKIIGPGLRDDADLRSGALAIFGGVGIGEHIKFADGIDTQQDIRWFRRE